MRNNSPKKKNRGKILKIKQGYNPNSSSMGSIVFVLPAIMFAVFITAGAVLGALSSLLTGKRGDTGKNSMQTFFMRHYLKQQEKTVRKRTR